MLARMDVMEQLRAWGDAHAQARSAECKAQRSGDGAGTGDLWREAKSLRERADRMHHEIYRRLGHKDGATVR